MIRVNPLKREPVNARPTLGRASWARQLITSRLEIHLPVNMQGESTKDRVYGDSKMSIVRAFLV